MLVVFDHLSIDSLRNATSLLAMFKLRSQLVKAKEYKDPSIKWYNIYPTYSHFTNCLFGSSFAKVSDSKPDRIYIHLCIINIWPTALLL